MKKLTLFISIIMTCIILAGCSMDSSVNTSEPPAEASDPMESPVIEPADEQAIEVQPDETQLESDSLEEPNAESEAIAQPAYWELISFQASSPAPKGYLIGGHLITVTGAQFYMIDCAKFKSSRMDDLPDVGETVSLTFENWANGHNMSESIMEGIVTIKNEDSTAIDVVYNNSSDPVNIQLVYQAVY